MRLAAKRDANELLLVRIFESLGGVWWYGGPLDGYAAHSKWDGYAVPTEIKNPEGRDRLTESQKKFIRDCMRYELHYFVWRYENDIYRAVGAQRTA